jgi:hypothetical protein
MYAFKCDNCGKYCELNDKADLPFRLDNIELKTSKKLTNLKIAIYDGEDEYEKSFDLCKSCFKILLSDTLKSLPD